MPRAVYAILSVISLLVCLAAPFLFLRQAVTEGTYKALLTGASVGWFFFATAWVSRAGRAR